MGRRKQGERLENHRLNPRKSPPQPTSTIASKTTRYAPSGGNSPTRQSVTAQQLELSICARDECQTARKQLPGPTGFLSNPSEAELKSWTPFIRDFLRKRRAARAQQPPTGLEKTREERNDANHIEMDQKGMSRAINHSLSDLPPKAHPLSPSSMQTTRFDAFLCVENSSKPPQPPSDMSQTYGDEHATSLTPGTCIRT